MNLETNLGTAEKRESIRNKIKTELKSLGTPEVPEIAERFVVLEENSGFNDDTRMISEGIRNVLEFIDSFTLKPIEKKRLLLATYLHDIGKSSASENPECQLAVTKLFSIEKIDNPNQTVGKTLQDYFSSEKDAMIAELARDNVTPDMTMRDFWDKHAFWTAEVLGRYTDIIDKQTRMIAASHHLYKNINPSSIININDVEEVSNELKYSIFLLMAIDVYQALIVRGEKTHEQAMQSLGSILGQYEGDEIFELIKKTINQLGATGSIFSEEAVVARRKLAKETK